jgi:hypothetical protein
MNGRYVVRLALAAALFGAAIPGAAMAQYPNSGGKWWTPNNTQSQRFQRGDFEGRWLAQDRFDSNYRGGRGVMLPDFLSIDQRRRLISIADGRNRVVQVIAIEDGFRGMRQPATFLRGEIRGFQLVAHGTDGRGRQMTQTMTLRDRGRTMVVRTRLERGAGRTVVLEKVYQRA